MDAAKEQLAKKPVQSSGTPSYMQPTKRSALNNEKKDSAGPVRAADLTSRGKPTPAPAAKKPRVPITSTPSRNRPDANAKPAQTSNRLGLPRNNASGATTSRTAA